MFNLIEEVTKLLRMDHIVAGLYNSKIENFPLNDELSLVSMRLTTLCYDKTFVNGYKTMVKVIESFLLL